LTGIKSSDQAVFGPVPSRRLGLSLGVDLVLPKTCSLNCRYCELGPTTNLTTTRGRFRDAQEVLRQVAARLEELEDPPDFVTLAGSGEPTLHQDLGLVLNEIKEMTPARLAVLTNGTLATDPQVRAELCQADVLVPSLDAVSDDIFRRLNRPAPGLHPAEIIKGLVSLSREFQGELYLEILLAAGFNDSPDEVEKLVQAAADIRPAKVQLNTVVRPPAVDGTLPVGPERLDEIAGLFTVPVEVAAAPQSRSRGDHGQLAQEIVEMTRRRPCTKEDVAAMTGLEQSQAEELIQGLEKQGQLTKERFGSKVFYRGV
jgi:wyosine [tRNA(Phe)-imidazoG37] synthetase (radical SAM superfamily)